MQFTDAPHPDSAPERQAKRKRDRAIRLAISLKDQGARWWQSTLQYPRGTEETILNGWHAALLIVSWLTGVLGVIGAAAGAATLVSWIMRDRPSRQRKTAAILAVIAVVLMGAYLVPRVIERIIMPH